MASYVALEPPRHDAAEKVVLIRDGFHLAGFLVPVLWFAWHRMWREAVLALVVTVAISSVVAIAGLGNAAFWLTVLVGLYVGLEGAALRIAALERADWTIRGVVEAADLEDAEIRHLSVREETRSVPLHVAGPRVRTSPHVRHSAPVLGLMGYPGDR